MQSYSQILKNNYFSLLFCSICCLSILYLGLTIDPLLSLDSTEYITMAKGITEQGTIWFFSTYTLAPPLYPLLIASLISLGVEPTASGHLIPVLAFALLVFPTFYLGKEIGNVYVGYCSSILVITSSMNWTLATMVWTEMPFIFFSMAAALFLVNYIKYKQLSTLIIGGTFVALTSMERYVGILIVISSVLIIFYFEIYMNKQKIWRFLLFFALSVIPISLVFIRNFFVKQGFYYTSTTAPSTPLLTLLETGFFKIRGIFPSLVNTEYSAFLLLFILILLIVLPILLTKFDNLPKKEIQNYVILISPVLIYIAAFILIFETLYLFWRGSGDHMRYQVVIIPLCVILLFSIFAFNYNIILTKKTHKKVYLLIIILIFLITASSQIFSFPQTYKNLEDGNAAFSCNYGRANLVGGSCSPEDLQRMSINPLFETMRYIWHKPPPSNMANPKY